MLVLLQGIVVCLVTAGLCRAQGRVMTLGYVEAADGPVAGARVVLFSDRGALRREPADVLELVSDETGKVGARLIDGRCYSGYACVVRGKTCRFSQVEECIVARGTFWLRLGSEAPLVPKLWVEGSDAFWQRLQGKFRVRCQAKNRLSFAADRVGNVLRLPAVPPALFRLEVVLPSGHVAYSTPVDRHWLTTYASDTPQRTLEAEKPRLLELVYTSDGRARPVPDTGFLELDGARLRADCPRSLVFTWEYYLSGEIRRLVGGFAGLEIRDVSESLADNLLYLRQRHVTKLEPGATLRGVLRDAERVSDRIIVELQRKNRRGKWRHETHVVSVGSSGEFEVRGVSVGARVRLGLPVRLENGRPQCVVLWVGTVSRPGCMSLGELSVGALRSTLVTVRKVDGARESDARVALLADATGFDLEPVVVRTSSRGECHIRYPADGAFTCAAFGDRCFVMAAATKELEFVLKPRLAKIVVLDADGKRVEGASLSLSRDLSCQVPLARRFAIAWSSAGPRTDEEGTAMLAVPFPFGQYSVSAYDERGGKIRMGGTSVAGRDLLRSGLVLKID